MAHPSVSAHNKVVTAFRLDATWDETEKMIQKFKRLTIAETIKFRLFYELTAARTASLCVDQRVL